MGKYIDKGWSKEAIKIDSPNSIHSKGPTVLPKPGGLYPRAFSILHTVQLRRKTDPLVFRTEPADRRRWVAANTRNFRPQL